jgi:hypothetical protein
MRRLAALLLLLVPLAPAAAQVPPGFPAATLEALRRDFPLDYGALAGGLAGKAPEEARRLAFAGVERFGAAHLSSVLAAPDSLLLGLEVRQGALLRALQGQDVGLCARVGDRGFFSAEALAGASPLGLDEYGAAVVEAAKAGVGRAPSASEVTKEDFNAWLDAVARIEPRVPVREMLLDPALRVAATPDHLCRGAAAMHEAVAKLPAAVGARIARLLLRSVIGAARR